MSVVEFYLLNRFPVPYGKVHTPKQLAVIPHWRKQLLKKGAFYAALYFIVVAAVAAFIGQYIISKMISLTGRASLIIFVLAFTIFISAISLGEI